MMTENVTARGESGGGGVAGDWCSRWPLMYYALAGLALVTVALSLVLGNRMLEQSSRAVAFNDAWAARWSKLLELSRLAVEMRIPASEALNGEPIEKERAKLQAVERDIRMRLAETRGEINRLDRRDGLVLSASLGRAESDLEAGLRAAGDAISMSELGALEEAAGECVKLDRCISAAGLSIQDTMTMAKDLRSQWFREQARTVESLRKVEVAIAGLIAASVAGAVVHGHRLAKRARRSERSMHEHSLALERANEDLGRARDAAEESARAKSSFLANMSHEIRTPMTAILGFTEVMLDSGATDSDKNNAALTLKRNSAHLLTLINDILDLSKIEAGRMEMEITECATSPILRDVLDLCGLRAAERRLALTIGLDGPIPERVQTDSIRLKQALVNLVSNAVKFTERGTVKVTASCEPGAERMRFRVTDTGIGMTGEQIARLFKPFTQADVSTTRVFGGTGLGLSITKWIASQLGGDVSVESVPGEGSVFTLTIATGPLAGVRMVEDLDEAETPDENLHDSIAAGLNGRILLVEDGPDNQRLISYLLKRAGAQVEVAENGLVGMERALAAMTRGDSFGVILMDMQMPVLDGYEATRKLRERGYTGQIVALTAHAMKGEQEKCLSAGCDHYLSKPIRREVLVREVKRRMGRESGRAMPRAA